MSLLEELGINLSLYFSLSKSNRGHVAGIVEGMLDKRTVNLEEIAHGFTHVKGTAKTRSRHLATFFTKNELVDEEYIHFILLNLFDEDENFSLAIDRTDWSFGQTRHNLLIVSVLYQGSAVPLMILPLERKGNSNTKQRIDIIDKILNIVPWYRIEMLVGDREFIGNGWFKGLCERLIPFAMRIRDNIYVTQILESKKAEETKQKPQLISQLPDDFHGKVHIGTQILYLSKKKTAKDTICLISAMVKNPLEAYKKRSRIETGFKCLKTNGFNLEDTHLRAAKKVKMLTQFAGIATMLALKTAHIVQPQEVNSKKNMALPILHTSKQDLVCFVK